MLIALELLLFILAGVAIKYWHAQRTVAASAPELGLRLQETREGQLRVEWNPVAQPVRTATLGRLEIKDGVMTQVISLTPDLLANGSYTHRRATERVDVRLVIIDAAGAGAEEESGFLGQPVLMVSSEMWQPTTEQLEAEAQRLRTTGERQAIRVQQLRDQLHVLEMKLGISELK